MRSAAAARRNAAAGPHIMVRAMGDRDQKRKQGNGHDAGDREGEGADEAFDLWLQRGLHRLYDTVANEPLPPELLRLIEEDRKERQKP